MLKAVSEQGQRLHIRKATLREWRSEFARHLRALGVAANATARCVRGETSIRKPDGIYRASLRGESTYMRERAESVARELAQGKMRIEPGKRSLVSTRNEVRAAWQSVGDMLFRDQQPELAAHVKRYAGQMAPVDGKGMDGHEADREIARSDTVRFLSQSQSREEGLVCVGL